MEPIWDKEAEQALIASCMLDPKQLDLLDIRPSHFRDTEHQKIWEAMISLPSPDAITVSSKSGVPINIINDIMMNDVRFWNVKEYAAIVRKMATERKAAELGGKILNDAYNGDVDITAYLKQINELSTVEDTGVQLLDMVSGTIDKVADRIERRSKGEKIEIGYQTGIGYIDRNFKGLKKGWLVYFAGSANVGKTQCAIQISKVLARQAPGSYVALEGDKESTVYRMLEGIMRVDAVDIEFGKVDATALYATLADFEGLDYEFFYQPRLTVHELRAYVAKQKAERNIGWLFVDYVSLLEVEGKDRNEKDENMSQELRRICGEFNVLMIGLDSIVKSGASGILSIEDIAGRYSKQHDSDITFGYSDYKPIKGIAEDLDDFERSRRCRLMGVLKDRHRKNKGKIFPLEMDNGLVNDLLESNNKPYI